jgi:hypothetical protein
MFGTWDRSLSSEGQVELEATVGTLSISGLIEMGLFSKPVWLKYWCLELTEMFLSLWVMALWEVVKEAISLIWR